MVKYALFQYVKGEVERRKLISYIDIIEPTNKEIEDFNLQLLTSDYIIAPCEKE